MLVVAARTIFILLAQALVVLLFFLRGSHTPWLAAAPWWTVYANLVDVSRLALLWKFTRAEGIIIRDLIGPLHLRYGRDIFLGILVFLCIFPCFVVGGTLAAHWLYGAYQVSACPGIMLGRVLPLWASIFSRFIWWMVWSPSEKTTNNGYALTPSGPLRPHLVRRFGASWWTIQHAFLPFIPDFISASAVSCRSSWLTGSWTSSRPLGLCNPASPASRFAHRVQNLVESSRPTPAPSSIHPRLREEATP